MAAFNAADYVKLIIVDNDSSRATASVCRDFMALNPVIVLGIVRPNVADSRFIAAARTCISADDVNQVIKKPLLESGAFEKGGRPPLTRYWFQDRKFERVLRFGHQSSTAFHCR